VKPDDLDDLDPVEPDAVLLEQVRSRGASLRRRRRVQRFGSVVVAVGVLAVAGGIALTVGGSNHSNMSGPPSSTTSPPTTSTQANVTVADLAGKWRPVSVADYQGPLTSPPLSSPSLLRFTTSSKWEGSDGCNGQDGTYALGARGAMHFALEVSTTMACREQTPTPQSLEAAARVEIRDGHLTIFDPGDHELAQFVRAGDKSVASLKAAALAWSNAFLTGTSADIFAMEGAECTPTTSMTLSGSTIAAYLAGEGGWKVADCHAPIGGSSSSGSSAAPSP
jgi:heat shock protein HslJ